MWKRSPLLISSLPYSQSVCVATMPGICRNLKTRGRCDDIGCLWRHDLTHFCSMCTVFCHSQSQLDAHTAGKKHLAAVAIQRLQQNLTCPTCNVAVPGGQHAWATHANGQRHRNNLISSNNHGIPAGPLHLQEQPGFCGVCLRMFPSAWDLKSHQRGRDHLRRLPLVGLVQTIKEAQCNKYSVTVSHEDGDVDFGFIDLQSLIRYPQRSMALTVCSTSRDTHIVEVRLTNPRTK